MTSPPPPLFPRGTFRYPSNNHYPADRSWTWKGRGAGTRGKGFHGPATGRAPVERGRPWKGAEGHPWKGISLVAFGCPWKGAGLPGTRGKVPWLSAPQGTRGKVGIPFHGCPMACFYVFAFHVYPKGHPWKAFGRVRRRKVPTAGHPWKGRLHGSNVERRGTGGHPWKKLSWQLLPNNCPSPFTQHAPSHLPSTA